ncbi:methyltransferase domain-containing protein [Myxococcaceae bacterium GXIMD 01537]
MTTAIAPAAVRSRYDEVSPKYKGPPAQVTHKLFWLAYEHLTWKPVEALLPKDKTWRVLDAGGGGGKFGVRFAELGHHVTVLDISPGMLEGAREEFSARGLLERASFVEGNVAQLAFPDASFDLVFCEGDPVSYCLDEYPKAIRELVRVAVPGAPVVLGVDNRFEYFTNALKYGKAPEAFDLLLNGKAACPYGLPVHTFTLRELQEAVRAAGAQVDEIFGKPVLFFELIDALKAARGKDVDLWAAREEILALQERLAHEGYGVTGQHLQVMARRNP